VQKRILEASLFGEEDEAEETPTQKKSKPREAEDAAQVKDKSKVDKNSDDGHSKALKHSLEAVGNSRRSSSNTPEPAAAKHVDDAGKSSRDKHSKHSSDTHRHHSHAKHHRTSSHTSSSSTRQTTTTLSAGRSTGAASSTQPSTKDDLSTVPGSSEKRTVSPLKLNKLPVLPSASTTSSSAQNHSSAHVMDMKKLFGDDDDDDIDDITDAATDSVPVVKDDTSHKESHHEPAEKAKKHSSHGSHKKVPDITHSSRSRSSLPLRGGTEKSDVQTSKSASKLSSSRSSDKHHHSEPSTDKRSTSAAAKSSGKPVASATKPDSVTSAVTESKTVMLDTVAKSSKVSHDVSDKSRRDSKTGGCEDDLVVSDSDGNDSSEANDVDVCDPQPEKPSSHGNQRSQADTAPVQQLPASLPEAKAANGEYISVLLELQKQLMSVADDNMLEKLTTVVEETGKYSISDDTFDFDLCRLDSHTVNKLKEFLATVAY